MAFNYFPVQATPQKQTKISPQLWAIINSSNTFTIRQHVKVLPKNCFACPPCAPQTNTYSIYAGASADNQLEFLRADEVSNDWNRCCCKPYHPLKLQVRQHIPVPGDIGFSDFSHLSADVSTDFQRIGANPRDRAIALQNMYQNQPVLFSVQRNDGQRCIAFPCKWLSTFVCFGCCQDGAHVYAGDLPNFPDQEEGRPNGPGPVETLLGSITQPVFGGCCIPFLELRNDNDAEEPYGKIAGPCFFGGWSEMCFSFQFLVSFYKSPRASGDIGLITKRRPQSLAGAAVELCSDADVYSVDFNSASGITAEQKLTILSAQMLLDYMLFDGNTQKCKNSDEAVYCYCCYFSVLGALIPCYVAIPKKN